MRISDWSSDVCSSDLQGCEGGTTKSLGRLKLRGWRRCRMSIRMFISNPDRQLAAKSSVDCCLVTCWHFLRLLNGTVDRKSVVVGKECVSTCRSRWSPDH